MAARRLIVVLVLLLAASILAASIAPDRTGRIVGVEPTTTEQTTTTTAPTTTVAPTTTAPPPAGVALRARIEASASHPQTIRATVGDQLALTVGSNPPRTIAIPALGLTEFAGDGAPARFDLLLRDAGTFPITDAEHPAQILGRIEVRDAPDPRKSGS